VLFLYLRSMMWLPVAWSSLHRASLGVVATRGGAAAASSHVLSHPSLSAAIPFTSTTSPMCNHDTLVQQEQRQPSLGSHRRGSRRRRARHLLAHLRRAASAPPWLAHRRHVRASTRAFLCHCALICALHCLQTRVHSFVLFASLLDAACSDSLSTTVLPGTCLVTCSVAAAHHQSRSPADWGAAARPAAAGTPAAGPPAAWPTASCARRAAARPPTSRVGAHS
jgi:hypothetical protein